MKIKVNISKSQYLIPEQVDLNVDTVFKCTGKTKDFGVFFVLIYIEESQET